MRIVFDLDGTLADGAHREHFITGKTKDWDAFFEASGEDLPIWPTIRVLEAMHLSEHQIEIWSGRGEGDGGKVREITRAWFARHVSGVVIVSYPPPNAFFSYRPGTSVALRLRPHGDYTPDNQLKKNWLDLARASEKEPGLIFDDRQKVVDMWRAEGIPCFQVAPGDF